MRSTHTFFGARPSGPIALAMTLPLLTMAGLSAPAHAQIVNESNWGSLTAPVYNTSETGPYAGAELFAGPNKFGTYYAGVLPNGKKVVPAGTSIQIGMNPLGCALTPDGKFLITSNDDERDGGIPSLVNPTNVGGYTLSVVNTATMEVVSTIKNAGRFFIGLQVKGHGPYTAYVSGGADQKVYLFKISATGQITMGTPASITIPPITPQNKGYVSNYTPVGVSTDSTPTGFSSAGAKITFPAGSSLSPEGRYLYVACNGDNSMAVIDTTTNAIVRQVPAGYFPYQVVLNATGTKALVSNWGITEYKFADPQYDASGNLTGLGTTKAINGVSGNLPAGFFVPVTSTSGSNPKTSSISVVNVPGGNPASAATLGAIYEGQPNGLEDLDPVGGTHPSAMAVVHGAGVDVLYITKSNNDSLGMIILNNNRKLPDFDLSPLSVTLPDGHKVHGAYPNAIVASANGKRVYVAEAGTNTVAVLDTTNPTKPVLLGRIPTGWYPTGLALSADNSSLYIVNAKGIGEDINPKTGKIESFTDGNFIFGSLQKVPLTGATYDNTTALGYNYAVHTPADTSVVPVGGAASSKIKHVIFILHENKTFDSMLGNLSGHFGPFAAESFNNADGTAITGLSAKQYVGVAKNLQLLANTFAGAVNYYSDSEESDAGHQFCASGTATDYTEKTLLVKSGRGLLVNKNFEPEDYPEGGYIFNNAARHSVSFKDYGAMIRIVGTDTGTSVPTTLNDPNSGLAGVPDVDANNDLVQPLNDLGDTETDTSFGLGQTYFMNLPILKVLGDNDPSTGEPRLDKKYPGYNFNISDQRRAKEFIADFDRMEKAGTLPQYLYIYQPNDHTGGAQAPNKSIVSPINLIADGDVGLGMVVSHIMKSKVYYDPATDTGAAIFITFDDAQSSLDHIHEHRTPLVVVSPFAKPGYVAKRHYVTASVVKTEELLLGLPPNNYGDLLATDLRDLFQSTYNGITEASIDTQFTRVASYQATPEGERIWKLVAKLDTSAPDRDSRRLGILTRLTLAADGLHKEADRKGHLRNREYRAVQDKLYAMAQKVVSAPAPKADLD